jgi:hypothetical protein
LARSKRGKITLEKRAKEIWYEQIRRTEQIALLQHIRENIRGADLCNKRKGDTSLDFQDMVADSVYLDP